MAIGMEFDVFIGIHIDVVQVCIVLSKRDGYASENAVAIPCFFAGFSIPDIISRQSALFTYVIRTVLAHSDHHQMLTRLPTVSHVNQFGTIAGLHLTVLPDTCLFSKVLEEITY